jgi:cellulose synthase operon protein YhjQ
MEPRGTDKDENLPTAEASEDSAVLYSWADLHGAKYRDFAISRRESRTQVRHRPDQQPREHALTASGQAKAAAMHETVESHDTVQVSYTGHERRRSPSLVSQSPIGSSASPSLPREYHGGGAISTPDPLSPTREMLLSQTPVPEEFAYGRRTDDFEEPRDSAQAQAASLLSTFEAEPAGPAWLYASSTPQVSQNPMAEQPPAPQPSVADTLQQSRERVAARWFALKGAFTKPDEDEPAPVRQKETRTPVLAVFSLAGGVGKTSLVATVGRSLSSMGEKVLLTDTTSHGLLPFYFGASELRQGTVRTFSPPSGSTDAPIYLVSHDMEQKGSDTAAQELAIEEIVSNSQGMHRILLDLTIASNWVIGQMARMNPTVLIPVAPDMNSVISLPFVEKFFRGLSDGDGRPLQPFYLLNQFDPSLPLHLDIREVLRRQLGDRLLPFVVRRAASVSEALAEGMTVVDYAPDEPVAEDYISIATWLRNIAAPSTSGFRNLRWSEREG